MKAVERKAMESRFNEVKEALRARFGENISVRSIMPGYLLFEYNENRRGIPYKVLKDAEAITGFEDIEVRDSIGGYTIECKYYDVK